MQSPQSESTPRRLTLAYSHKRENSDDDFFKITVGKVDWYDPFFGIHKILNLATLLEKVNK